MAIKVINNGSTLVEIRVSKRSKKTNKINRRRIIMPETHMLRLEEIGIKSRVFKNIERSLTRDMEADHYPSNTPWTLLIESLFDWFKAPEGVLYWTVMALLPVINDNLVEYEYRNKEPKELYDLVLIAIVVERFVSGSTTWEGLQEEIKGLEELLEEYKNRLGHPHRYLSSYLVHTHNRFATMNHSQRTHLLNAVSSIYRDKRKEQ